MIEFLAGSLLCTLSILDALPPMRSTKSADVLLSVLSVCLKSTPLSKRWDASVFKLCFLATPARLIGLKKADSNKIFFVSAVTLVSRPPIIPARANTFLSSAITSSSP